MTIRHPIAIGAPRGMVPGNAVPKAPTILDRDDDDFVTAVLEDYRSDSGRASLAASVASERAADGTLKLFQPIQRRYHLALLEAWCDTPGRPRLDPARVDAAGMVLRRIGQDADGNRVLQGWMRAAGRLRGWVPIASLGPADADPRPTIRLRRRATGQPQIDRALVKRSAGTDPAVLDEHVVPMFVAPPDVCAEAGRSLYYGVVQTSSSELAGTPPDTAAVFQGFGPDSQSFTDHLVQPLRGIAYSFPNAGVRFDTTWFETLLRSTDSGQQRFLSLLRQVAVEFDAFGTGAEGQAVFAELQTISLDYVLQSGETTPRTVAAGTFLKNAASVLLEGDTSLGSLEMPRSWPALETAAAARLAGAMSQAVQARFTAVKGRPGRFDEPGARYVLRAFLRLKPDSDCPGKTLWSDYSEPFVIAPWYEGGGTPAQIPMPDVTDRKLLKSLKPNVSFVLPPSLQCMLGGSPDDMIKGSFPSSCKSGGGIGLGWICSFSIPIITLCAFIVLNIFLSLFDLFFRWMLFIKICIPFPKSKDS